LTEMEPLDLFGRSGFINADFWTPVVYLAMRFWPMVVGTLVSHWRVILGWGDSVTSVDKFLSLELTRIHVMVLLLPFLSGAAWFIFGEANQWFVLLALMGLFYFWPKFFSLAQG
jgi:hypothetical protein